MLFDLRGKRRRVVQVVYATLAALFLVGFVGFSIGSDAPGGLFDAFGVGGSGDTGASLSSQYDDQIDSANEQLVKDPKDTAALLKLSKYQWYKGKEGISTDPDTGVPSISEDGHTELGNAADAWEKYLEVNKGKPNSAIATQMVQAYYYLGDAQGAAEAQRIVAEDQPNSGAWDDVAYYLYLAGDISEGDQAATKAEAEAPKAQRSQIKQDLDQIRKQALKLKKQQAKAQKDAPPGDNPLQNPFGGAGTAP
ncbi:MAG: hypothetical protein AABM66_04920 [Actinomycetota bacterium]